MLTSGLMFQKVINAGLFYKKKMKIIVGNMMNIVGKMQLQDMLVYASKLPFSLFSLGFNIFACCIPLPTAGECCIVLPSVVLCCMMFDCIAKYCVVLYCVPVFCILLQSVVWCCRICQQHLAMLTEQSVIGRRMRIKCAKFKGSKMKTHTVVVVAKFLKFISREKIYLL